MASIMRIEKVGILIVDLKKKDNHDNVLFFLFWRSKKFLGASLTNISEKMFQISF